MGKFLIITGLFFVSTTVFGRDQRSVRIEEFREYSYKYIYDKMYCRYCESERTHKSGKNFLETDGRIKESTQVKRALAVMLYTFSKASYNFLAKKIFHCSPTTIMNWIKKASTKVKMPEITRFCRHKNCVILKSKK